jgi:malate dehydrogenase
VHHTKVKGKAVVNKVDKVWYESTFIPAVQQRGAAVIAARGLSSAASAANAAISHMRSWALGTAKGDWVSMGIHSDGSYGIQKGLIYSFPCTCKGGKWSIVQGLKINDFSRAKMQATEKELAEEMEAVKHLLPEVNLSMLKKGPAKKAAAKKAKAKPVAKKKPAAKKKK